MRPMKSPEPDLQPPQIPPHLPAVERIVARLTYLYGEDRAGRIARRVQRLLETHRQLRTRVLQGPLWTHRDLVLITYADSIQSSTHPPLQTLHLFLNAHLTDAFSMVHILPFFPWSSDDGFSVTDFRAVKTDLGSWQDVKRLAEDFDLAIDLVLNHCSRENLWFIDYLFGDQPACDYFIDVDPEHTLDEIYRNLDRSESDRSVARHAVAERRAHPDRDAPCVDDVQQRPD